MQLTPHIKKVTNDEEQAQAFAVRRVVFIEGQGVDESIEIDGMDSECSQYLLMLDDKAIGTARICWMGDEAKIQRVAILEEHRGKGYAKLLMAQLMRDIQDTAVSTIKLSAQLPAVPLYEAFGFVAHGDHYLEANILHVDMKRAA